MSKDDTQELPLLVGHKQKDPISEAHDKVRPCNLRSYILLVITGGVWLLGILGGLMGHASRADVEVIEKQLARVLADDELVEEAYQLVRDFFVFTNKRFILVDKQGLTGKKVEYHSIPYRSIVRFSVETAGHFDLDAELKIWVRGMEAPILKEFRKEACIYDVQKALAKYSL